MRIWIVLLLFLLTIRGAAQEVHFPLDDGWRFRQVGQEQWYPAQVPGVVQSDLLRNGLIPDFMHGTNIDSVQWVENEDWVYERTLVVTEAMLRHGHLELVFKGLDTFAEVYVNDTLLGRPDNMFRRWEWDVKRVLRKGENELRVVFRSPTKEGVKLRDAYGIQLPHDSDPSGVSPYIRKAAYQFGWDFCPRLVTSGIWQSVELAGGPEHGSRGPRPPWSRKVRHGWPNAPSRPHHLPPPRPRSMCVWAAKPGKGRWPSTAPPKWSGSHWTVRISGSRV